MATQSQSNPCNSKSSNTLNPRNHDDFKVIYDDNVGLLMYVARQFRLSHEEREDLLQEAFMRLIVAKGSFTSESVKGFLVVALRRLVIDKARRSKTRKTESIGADLADYETKLWNSDPNHENAVAKIAEVIDEISKQPGNKAFAMFYKDGLSAREIGERLHEPVGSVTAKLCRLRERNKTLIRERVEEVVNAHI